MRFGVILAIPLVLGMAEAGQASPRHVQKRWQPPTVVVTQHGRLPGLRFWGEPHAWTSNMTPPRHRTGPRKAWRHRHVASVIAGPTLLPGLSFYGQPYAWTTPMAPRVRQAEIRHAPPIVVVPYRPAVLLDDQSAPAPRLNRARTTREPDAEPFDRKRPSGTAEPKATRTIPLFNVPDDQR